MTKIHQPEMGLPTIALSVRQPWAWALVTGHKDIENRSTFAVSKAGFDPRPVAIHAAQGMTRAEYDYAARFMESLGVQCPHPSGLVRGAIIGAVAGTLPWMKAWPSEARPSHKVKTVDQIDIMPLFE